MLALAAPRKPAPLLAWRRAGRTLDWPDAFGNALGSSIAEAIGNPDQTGANARSERNNFNRENDDYYSTSEQDHLGDVVPEPGDSETLVPNAFSRRLYDETNLQAELEQRLNLNPNAGRQFKAAYIDPMGGVWGSLRDPEITGSFGGSSSEVQSQSSPNKYEDYDLGTPEGMKNFLVDVSLAKSLNMDLPVDMTTTAKAIASNYFGESGSLGQTARSVLRANDEILSDRFLTSTGRILIYQTLNKKFGTNIDASALTRFEGGQLLDGYVPQKDGKVLGRSGATIGTGFDIGQMNEKQLATLGLPNDLEDKLRPYVSLIKQDSVDFLRANPLSITHGEAMQIDLAVKEQHLRSTIQSWNNSDPTATFEDLTRAQQTVLFSRTFHQGMGMPKTSVAQDFYTAALQGRWSEAETALRTYDVRQKWYQNRVQAEADLLLKERSK